jgi:prepilin-type N-terminal cleavage/methylation domain-containing protein
MRTRPSPRRRGFTILEILIAIVVLVLGITGIIALFPTAIESGNKTIEDSYASAITQSVVDALTVGLRESRYQYRVPGTGKTYTYFVFNHDGVVDGPPVQGGQVKPEGYADYANTKGTWNLFSRDWCIVLPECTGSEPNVQSSREPIFLYPTPRSTPGLPADSYFQYATAIGEQRKWTTLDTPASQIDNFHQNFFRPTTEGVQTPWIPAVYHLGRYRDGPTPLPSGKVPGEVRQEYRGDRISIGTATQETLAIDPYPSYSFAFTLQRARLDTCNASCTGPTHAIHVPDGQINIAVDAFVSTLYQLRVMVFKNFNAQAAGALAPTGTFNNNPAAYTGTEVVPKTNIPVREFVTLISL